MALPRERDSHSNYTDQLVYFSARLAANPDTAELADKVDDLLAEIDAGFEVLRTARRAEVRARAQRDHTDDMGDAGVGKLRRQVRVFSDAEFLPERLFPKGLSHAVAPRGRPQLERLDQLLTAFEELTASPRVEAHAEGEEIAALLGEGKQQITDAREALRQAIEHWEAVSLELAQARDAFNFRRSEGVDRLGAVIGELRALLGGKRDAAYAFTAPSRRGGAAAEDEEALEEGEAA